MLGEQAADTTVLFVKRLKNSRNGNGRFKITTEHGVFESKTDAAVNFDIQNELAIDANTHTRVLLGLTNGKVVDLHVL